jgi:hypothetical protein
MERLAKSRMLGAALAALVGVLGACKGHDEPANVGGAQMQPPPTGAQVADANTTDPHWVYPRNPQNKVAVVFIHGLFGDTNGTWTNKNGKTFFELLKENPDVGPNVDIYAFGFTSEMIGAGSLDIAEAAAKLNEFLDFHRVSSYD